MYPYSTIDLSKLKLMLAEDLGTIVSWEYDIATDWIVFSHEIFEQANVIDPAGYSLDKVLAKYVHPDDIPRCRSGFDAGVRSGAIEGLEIRIRLENGSCRDIRLEGSMLADDCGSGRMVGAFQDVTERRTNQRKINDRLLILDTVLNHIPKPIFYQDLSFRYQHCNKAFLDFAEKEQAEITGRAISDFVSEELAAISLQCNEKLLESLQNQSYQTKYFRRDGSVRDIRVTKSTVADNQNHVIGFVGVVEDMTELLVEDERRKKLAQIKDIVLEINNAILEKTALEDIFEFVLDRTIDSIDAAELGTISMLDEHGVLSFSSSRGYDPNVLNALKIPLKECFQWKATGGNLKKTIIMNHLETFDSFIGVENIYHKNIQSSISAPLILEGELLGFLAIDSTNDDAFTEDDAYLVEYLRGQLVNSISRFQLYEGIVHMTDHDAQTGLYNRRYFENIFDMTRERCLRYNEDFMFVVFDLDGLKKINDTKGHLAGDHLIQSFAEALSGELRASDILARTGGDEFAAILFRSGSDQVVNRLESLKDHLSEHPVISQGQEIVCSFSYGLARFPLEGRTYDELMEIADNRMYQNKDRPKRK